MRKQIFITINMLTAFLARPFLMRAPVLSVMIILALPFSSLASPSLLSRSLQCQGQAKQGGVLICKTTPHATIKLADKNGTILTQADTKGRVILGFDRDAPAFSTLSITHKGKTKIQKYKIFITPRHYDVQHINGLPPAQVSNFSAQALTHINASSTRKKQGFASLKPTVHLVPSRTKPAFDFPVKGIKTSPFGAQRILNGQPKRPHHGIDIAAPTGTSLNAPADGIVTLADNDLYFEGAMVLIDHGQGLVSAYLHMEDITTSPDQYLTRGQRFGTVGARGRTTGPHVCWRLRWRGRHLDPELLTLPPQTISIYDEPAR